MHVFNSLQQEGLLSLTAQHPVCETWNAHLSYWGRCFRPKVYGNGVTHCQNVYTVRWAVARATTLSL